MDERERRAYPERRWRGRVQSAPEEEGEGRARAEGKIAVSEGQKQTFFRRLEER